MPKATKEDYENSRDYRTYVKTLDDLGIRPKDPKHPLKDFPASRLWGAIMLITDASDKDAFAISLSQFSQGQEGVTPVGKDHIADLLNDSRGIIDIRLAQAIGLVSHWAMLHRLKDNSDRMTAYYRARERGEDAERPRQPSPPGAYFGTYREMTAHLFGVGGENAKAAKAAALMSLVSRMDERQLDALLSVAGLCRDADVHIPEQPEECAALTLERLESARKSLDRMREGARRWAEAFSPEGEEGSGVPF